MGLRWSPLRCCDEGIEAGQPLLCDRSRGLDSELQQWIGAGAVLRFRLESPCVIVPPPRNEFNAAVQCVSYPTLSSARPLGLWPSWGS